MNYKKVIKSRAVREKILNFLSFVPDKIMIKLQYWIKFGRILDLKNPKRFTEKLQWYKLNYRNSLMIQCVDKYDVRKYVESEGLGHILLDCYGVFEQVEDIKWNNLPKSFVLKDTLGGGGNSVIIVKDKNVVDFDKLIKQCRKWTEVDAHKKSFGREWSYYSGKKHRILIEEYIDNNGNDLPDYKFFCFNGHPTYMYYMAGRKLGEGVELGIFDENFVRIQAQRNDERVLTRKVVKPNNFEEMKDIAGKLSSKFPEARIDLYSVKEKTIFGEITFFDGSGYMSFSPDSFDYEFGKKFLLP